MRLHSISFQKIKSGVKTIEIRLLDDKRKLINIGDNIELVLRSDESQSITMRVVELVQAKTFSEVLESYPIEYFGGDIKEEKLEELYSLYTKDEERECGVVGIKLEYIS